MEDKLLKKYSAFNNESGEVEDIQDVLNEILKTGGLKVVTNKKPYERVVELLEKNPMALSDKELVDLAKKLKTPINSFGDFYMSDIKDSRLDTMSKLKPNTAKFLLCTLFEIKEGGYCDTYNGIKIENFEHLCELMSLSKSVVYSMRKELDSLNLAKMNMYEDRYIIILNPTIFKRKFIVKTVFDAYEEDIKKSNFLEYIYYKRKFSIECGKLIKRRKIPKWQYLSYR